MIDFLLYLPRLGVLIGLLQSPSLRLLIGNLFLFRILEFNQDCKDDIFCIDDQFEINLIIKMLQMKKEGNKYFMICKQSIIARKTNPYQIVHFMESKAYIEATSLFLQQLTLTAVRCPCILIKQISLKKIISLMQKISQCPLFKTKAYGFMEIEGWLKYFIQKRINKKYIQKDTLGITFDKERTEEIKRLEKYCQSIDQFDQKILKYPLAQITSQTYLKIKAQLLLAQKLYLKNLLLKQQQKSLNKKPKKKTKRKKPQAKMQIKENEENKDQEESKPNKEKKLQKININQKVTKKEKEVDVDQKQLKISSHSTSDSVVENQKSKQKKTNQKKLQKDQCLGKKLIENIIRLKLNADFLSQSDKHSKKFNSTLQNRKNIFNRLRMIIKSINNHFIVKLFGSNAIGIALQNSDIDILVQDGCNMCFANESTCQKQRAAKILNHIQKMIQNFLWITEIKKIFRAAVPILKIKCNPNISFQQKRYYGLNQPRQLQNGIQIKVDISIQRIQQFGLLSTKYMKQWCLQNNYYSVMIVLKYVLQKYNFHQSYSGKLKQAGGISSYGLLLLIVALVKHLQKKPKSDFQLFMKVLHFYGYDINFSTTSIDPSSQIPFKPVQCINPQWYLYLIDPLSKGNILMYTHQIGQIKKLFCRLYDQVLKGCQVLKEDLGSRRKWQFGKLNGLPLQQKYEIVNNKINSNLISKCIQSQ